MTAEGPSSDALLFVYGALMQGCEFHHYLQDATFAGKAWTEGTLVSLGRYSGLVRGNGTVHGELYILNDPPADLDALDDLEEFNPASPDTSVYLREARTVHKDDGTTAVAWAYMYNRDVADAAVIPTGDWRDR